MATTGWRRGGGATPAWASTALAASLAAFLGASRYGANGFVVAPPAGSLQPPAMMQSIAATGREGRGASQTASGSMVLPLLGSLCLIAAAKLSKRPALQSPSASVLVATQSSGPSFLVGGSCEATSDEPRVTMYSAGGRRNRLGVGGKVCMLTGAKKFKGFTRSFHGKKAIRYWRPNVRWSKFWWKREKKWVRLFTTDDAIRLVDTHGLEYMCRKAGLDLYAWCKPHWEPGSRQPLCLKVGYTAQAKNDLKRWPDYMHLLNKGRPLADYLPAPDPLKRPVPMKLRKLMRNPATPPKRLNVTMISPK
eukprot:TRINITY_DN9946_c0_g1_i1.p1 TRINITY_DN9946_c0_g1~~TRINITY_DN9946_c0_g1_i1.p1  ORF type:complete len:329 (+),score=47.86 TRINITY_DN9946_c0_g1_i1:70-987(+)